MSRNLTFSLYGYLEPANTLLRRHDAYVLATRFEGLGKTYVAVTQHKFLRKQFSTNGFRSITILVG